MSRRAKPKQTVLEYLQENYFKDSLHAEQAVKLGIVYLNEKLVKRGGVELNPEIDKVRLVGEGKLFVSRGGYKLQKALENFKVPVKDRICMDVGASTGGFTDCFLQYGANKVYAIDTGHGQLSWTLRKNDKVKYVDRTNVRYLLPEHLYQDEKENAEQRPNLIAIDVSFISVLKILPSVQKLVVSEASEFLILIKPQFEAGKDHVGRGGVIRNPSMHFQILKDLVFGFYRAGLKLKHMTHSPLLGASGNIEFLAHLIWDNNKATKDLSIEQIIDEWIHKIVDVAYEDLGLEK